MKKLIYILVLISILSCNSKQTNETAFDKTKNETTAVSVPLKTELIIGERIDGPANIRNKPNGDILFELNDNTLVEVTTKPINDWYEILIYADIEYYEYPMDSILKNRPIVMNNDSIGRVIQSHSVSSGQGGNFAYAMLYGYTHKNYIKPETVNETAFRKNLAENGRNFLDWKEFIKTFKLDGDAVGYDKFQSFYNYENTIEDPSPGFRIVLLFEKQNLIGLIHSREIQINNAKTHRLNWSYFVTFFNDYSEKDQIDFVNYMNEWIQGVD
jgi:hypothetical protein